MEAGMLMSQLAIVVALVGMGLGWRGVMTKYSGFYDLNTAWSMMFWGILFGGFYGSLGDKFLLSPYILQEQTSISNLIICLLLAVVTHLMLRREKVRKTGSQPTTGWAFGLAVGGMLGMMIIYRIIETNELTLTTVATITLVALISPRSHALVMCRHGYEMLLGKRWTAVFKTFFLLCLLITTLYSTMFQPLTWIFLIPPIILVEKQAHEWVYAAVPQQARRRLRRIWKDAAKTKPVEEE
jgi:hypothetical protein